MTRPALPGATGILLVGDDPGDVLMTREAFEQHHLGLQLHVVGDGEEALRFLRRTGDFAAAPRPTPIVLDLNLPRRSGLEVLAELKADDDLRIIPVVVLTTSQAEQDILRSYQLHANAYVIKPFDADQFTDAIRQIDDFFLTLVQQPALGAQLPLEDIKVPLSCPRLDRRTYRILADGRLSPLAAAYRGSPYGPRGSSGELC